MLKNIVQLEHAIEGRVGRFICDNDLPIPVAKEMLFQFLKFLGQIEDQAMAQQKEAEDKAKEENKETA